MKAANYDLASPEFAANPFPTLAQMSSDEAVVRTQFPRLGEAWIATTYESVQRVLRDQESFVMEPQNAGKKYLPGLGWWVPKMVKNFTKHMLNRDGKNHRRLRTLVDKAFARHSVEGMRGRLESLTDELIEKMIASASPQGEVDLLAEFARPLPLTVICEVLGLPLADRAKFTRWADSVLSTSTPLQLLWAIPTFMKLNRYFREQFRLCREQPREGLISALVEAEEEGDRLSEDELVAMLFLLLIAGHETTVHLITSSVIALLERPEQKARLMADWSHAETAVDESLRFNSPVMFAKARYAARDMEFYGRELKQGDYVVPCLAAANRDEAVFASADVFEVDRANANRHVALGSGVHLCLGAKLTRTEGAIALEALFTRLPDLQLAIPAEEIPYVTSLGTIRGVKALPVKLDKPSVQSESSIRYVPAHRMPMACESLAG